MPPPGPRARVPPTAIPPPVARAGRGSTRARSARVLAHLTLGSVVAGLATAAGGCQGAAGPPGIDTPNADRILVYFPVGDGGRVRGRAFPGTFRSGQAVPFAFIRSHPTSLAAQRFEVKLDGGFDFGVIASGREILEISGSRDPAGEVLGPPAFVEVPPVPVPAATFRCCRSPGASRGTCIPRSAYEEQLDPDRGEPVDCPPLDPRPVLRCASDRECIVLSRRHYEIDPRAITVGAPGPDGRVVVRGAPGAVVAHGLVRIENRRLRGLGRNDAVVRQTVIAEEDGAFESPPLVAQGDDEIVLEVIDLNDFRSPTLSRHVDDPPLESAQILEIWPRSDLSTQLGGFVGLRFWLTGIDGHGLCPDAPGADPPLCFSGGLLPEHVTITKAYIDRPEQEVVLCPALAAGDPRPAEPPCGGPDVERLVAPTAKRGLEGDVRAGPVDVVLIADLSPAPDARVSRDAYFAALASWLDRLRVADRVGILTTGRESFSGLRARDEAREVLASLRSQEPSGPRHPFEAVRAAAEALDRARSARGRILLTGLGGAATWPAPDDPSGPFLRALEAVQPGARSPGVPVDVLGHDLDAPPPGPGSPSDRRTTMRSLLESLASFSGPVGSPGRRYDDVQSPRDLQLRLRDQVGQAAGGFNLLYELIAKDDPVEVGDPAAKLGELRVEATVTVPTGTTKLRYRGPLEFRKLIAP